MGEAIMTDIVGVLTSGISGIATGIGGGLSTLAKELFVNTTAGEAIGLSTFGTLVVVFAGVSLAIGLSRWVLNFVSSLGARNR